MAPEAMRLPAHRMSCPSVITRHTNRVLPMPNSRPYDELRLFPLVSGKSPRGQAREFQAGTPAIFGEAWPAPEQWLPLSQPGIGAMAS
jgi:hypothetical protein